MTPAAEHHATKQHDFESQAALDNALSDTISDILHRAIAQRGRAVLAVSGGSTPKGLFACLSQANLDWDKVTVTLADERWVPASHRDSNERLVREQLLINRATGARFLSLTSEHDEPVRAEPDIDARLAELGPADVLVLGMGADGHTASLFPEASNLSQALDLACSQRCIAIDPVTAPHLRMSMSLSFLLASANIFVHITGADKRRIFEQACVDKDPRKAPIASVLSHASQPVHVYWAP